MRLVITFDLDSDPRATIRLKLVNHIAKAFYEAELDLTGSGYTRGFRIFIRGGFIVIEFTDPSYRNVIVLDLLNEAGGHIEQLLREIGLHLTVGELFIKFYPQGAPGDPKGKLRPAVILSYVDYILPDLQV